VSTSALFERLTTLAEPIRLRLLRVVAREELAVGELARVLQTSQPTVSRHLKQLDAGGWVVRRKVGTATWYRLSEELEEDAMRLWAVVAAEVEAEAEDPVSLYAEDLRRLEGVLSQRTEDSEELFRRLGGRWDAVRRELFGESFVVALLGALLAEGQVIADLGCGTGALLPVLAGSAARVIGVDREEAMLEVAAERVAALPNVELRQGLLDALPIETASVHLALCALVLHHVRELPAVFTEVARVLAPGARWVLVDMVEHDREEYRSTMGHQHPGFSEAQMGALAADAGLRLRSWRVLPPDPEAQGPGLFLAVIGEG
jgi:SAM-dependent methyltransferase/DNA-binding HxlR family transcriptional regulator